MVEAVQKAVRGRDGAVQAPEVEVVRFPWSPRPDDGSRAILVNERHAVWDKRVPAPEVVEQQTELEDVDVGALGSMPTVWTPDLVHCRLQAAATISKKLPRVVLPPMWRSFLGALQPQDAAPVGRGQLTDEETALLDWVMARLYVFDEEDRAVVMGVMSGRSFEKIAVVVAGIVSRHGGRVIKKAGIHRRYWRFCSLMANDWNEAGEPIDARTFRVWLKAAEKKV